MVSQSSVQAERDAAVPDSMLGGLVSFKHGMLFKRARMI